MYLIRYCFFASRLIFSMYLPSPAVEITPITKTMANAAKLSSGELLLFIIFLVIEGLFDGVKAKYSY